MTRCSEHEQTKMYGKGYTVRNAVTHYSFHNEISFSLCWGRVVVRVDLRYGEGEMSGD